MAFPGSGSADQHAVALLGDEAAAGEIAHQRLVDRRAGEVEVVEVLGERQAGDGELILDRAGLLLGDLRLEQIAAQSSLRRLRKLVCERCGSCWRLIAMARVSS